MPENWDDHATGWDQDERVRFYAEQAFASLIKHVPVQDDGWQNKRVLDFGCGTGLLSEKLAPLVREVIAVDVSEPMIGILRRKGIDNVTPICADIDKVHSSAPWFCEFDLIVASSVCGFLPNYEATVGLLSKALRDGGYFTQWDWLSSGDDRDGMTLERVSDAFRTANLKPVQVETAFSVIFDGETMPVLMGVGFATQPTSERPSSSND